MVSAKRSDFLVPLDGFRYDHAVRHGSEGLVDHQRGGKDRLEIRFIPTRKRAPGIGRFKLSGRHRLGCPSLIFVRAPIESSKRIVERAAKHHMQPPFTGGHGLRECQPAPL